MQRIIERFWWVFVLILLSCVFVWGVKNMYFHQDDLDWFLMAQKSTMEVMGSPIGDHVNYVFRVLLKIEWELFHLYFPGYLLVSVMMHGIVIWLIYKLAKAISQRGEIGAIAALIFTINTNWTESVLWISGQTISITVLFVLLTIWKIWEKKDVSLVMLLASWTSALSLGLMGAILLVYKRLRVMAIAMIIIVGLIYLWKGTDGTSVEYSFAWVIKVGVVWMLAIGNTVIGRLLFPFDRFEVARIGGVVFLFIYLGCRYRHQLFSMWKDNFSRFLIIQLTIYYLIVAVGRAQYGIGIMRAERYAYLGLALLLLLIARIMRNVEIRRWVWVVPMIVIIQSVGLYRRAEDYVVRPQQLKILVQKLTREGIRDAKSEDYLPYFVLNDERLKYRDLMLLIND